MLVLDSGGFGRLTERSTTWKSCVDGSPFGPRFGRS